MSKKLQRVVVVGASPNPERYSNRAVRMLLECGHEAVPVHPAVKEIEGIPVVKSIAEVAGQIDTVTLYVSSARSSGMQEELLKLKPRRVIFNPGAENPALRDALENAGVGTQEACTLVLLRTGQF
ncbi:MAG: CoA-binding protein [Pirellulales bacterium]|nr:CoA-binding protein [Pirellulales bacterium]